MTDINFNARSKSLEVSVRIFTDDFEKALQKNCHCKVELSKPADKAAMEKLISGYLTKHVQIKVDGKMMVWQFVGYQQEEGSTWNYFEVQNVPEVHTIELFNNILYEYNGEQINMIHIKANDKDRTDKLEYPGTGFSFTF